jgi:Mlc titration factor MtfA (ptsG expression regulator)/Tfp pilus assembly protein PilF
LLAEPLSPLWQDVLARNVAVYSKLPGSQQQKLVGAARIIAVERRFEGCKGLVVTEEMKITIAAQAALLVLGNEGYYFERVTSFLLYPYTMVLPPQGAPRGSEDDDLHEQAILGQAFQTGQIILSWPDVLRGGRVPNDGENVVLHELAHHLDGLDGQMGGSPPGLPADRQDHFHRVFEQSLDQFRRDLDRGIDTVLHPPAADSTTELFAYSTEAFFERPEVLCEQYPDLFDCLREFYKLDPREWFGGSHAKKKMPKRREILAEDNDEAAPDNLPTTPAELPPLATGDEHFARGQEFMNVGRFDLAAADFDRCVRLDPADQEAIVWRGRASLYLGEFEAAMADAERACKLDPDDREAHCLLAMCLVAAGRFEQSLTEFARAGIAVAEDVEAILCRGIARSECGDLHGAIADFTNVIEDHADDAEAWHERGRCYERLERIDNAVRDFEQARTLGFQDDTGERDRR